MILIIFSILLFFKEENFFEAKVKMTNNLDSLLHFMQVLESNSFEDLFYCLGIDGQKIGSEERILIISPEDYYFFHKVKFEDVTGKFIPKESDKSFAHPLIINGMVDDKNGGKLDIRCSYINNKFEGYVAICGM